MLRCPINWGTANPGGRHGSGYPEASSAEDRESVGFILPHVDRDCCGYRRLCVPAIRRGFPRAIVEKELPPLVSDLRGREGVIARSIQESYKEYRDDTKYWSGGYYGLLIFAAVLSALSGVALKLSHFIPNDGIRNDVAAILAGTSAIVITVTTTVDSQRKWQANRIAASDSEQIAIEFVTADPVERTNSLQHYSQRLQEIALARQQEIVGTRAVTDKGKPDKASDTK
jgi:hypothetical protein